MVGETRSQDSLMNVGEPKRYLLRDMHSRRKGRVNKLSLADRFRPLGWGKEGQGSYKRGQSRSKHMCCRTQVPGRCAGQFSTASAAVVIKRWGYYIYIYSVPRYASLLFQWQLAHDRICSSAEAPNCRRRPLAGEARLLYRVARLTSALPEEQATRTQRRGCEVWG
ncbi:uncharacterized protein EI97DRAFT_108506 [Westerdykella ornata]|uniref:Uncharacterized protein n=1 Tax=Westerdykella ornata TaxID=318751 RepID=A0A6A6JTY6_WESOR|nr:uncharacterized protein EI97DRAFT_108506 [Westerdykella ornata]KAF2280042.1 hypothetical protein EI97DRAFT_108506 [Westerdykella ornata]